MEGFIWELNSYDQWGVELGKVLAKNVRNILQENGGEVLEKSSINSATKSLMKSYIDHK